jgi:D-sedoheptulose 7-phosphate isomerase
MLKTLAAGEHIELGHSFVIGDTWRDVQAARAAGCTAIILDRDYNRRDEADYRVGNLAKAAQLIIRRCQLMNNELNGYIETYLEEVAEISRGLSRPAILKMVEELIALRRADGRLFILGVGGSAANASHAVNDFRKIADIESYTPTDNAAELTARINDDGWDSSYAAWLRASRLGAKDALLIFSVGGGNEQKRVSVNLVEAIRLARSVNAKVLGIVGRDGGYTAQVADACVIIPNVNGATVTPHTEAFQAVVWHLIVSHPALRANEMKWETVR